VVCTAAKVAEVPLQPAGQIFLVPVSVNGHTLQMILDTGAQKSVLTEFAV
jgi:predicted aspartyl protease